MKCNIIWLDDLHHDQRYCNSSPLLQVIHFVKHNLELDYLVQILTLEVVQGYMAEGRYAFTVPLRSNKN